MIVKQGRYEIKIELEDWDGNKTYANYDTFNIENHTGIYKLTVAGYSGDAGTCTFDVLT